jgi:hypothetical protein
MILVSFFGNVLMKSAIKHHQAPQGARKSDLVFWDKKEFFLRMRNAVVVLRHQTATIEVGVQRRHGAKRRGN